MAEYIDREALMDRIVAHIKRITPIEENRDMFYHDSGRNGAIAGVILEVENIPAADVVPVVNGEWELNDDGSATCKHCGRTTKYAWDYDSVFKYCPDCGSRNG